jgi:uncharacterized protein (DUF1697 family)
MRYIAFLRAVNVGGRAIKMDPLRVAFESLGFKNVETFIASGNVIFDSRALNSRALERKIEAHLQDRFGYRIDTFIRSAAEVAAIAKHEPFKGREMEGASVYIGLLGSAPSLDVKQKIESFGTTDELFHVHARELYWHRRPSMRMITFSGAVLEKTLGGRTTMRNANTIKRLATKLVLEDRMRNAKNDYRRTAGYRAGVIQRQRTKATRADR